jgi:hypothetical protein
MVHAVPRGTQLSSRHLYLLERLEDKVAAINSRIAAWQHWLAAALAPAAAGEAGAADGSNAYSGIEWSSVGAPVQVGWDRPLLQMVCRDGRGCAAATAAYQQELRKLIAEGRKFTRLQQNPLCYRSQACNRSWTVQAERRCHSSVVCLCWLLLQEESYFAGRIVCEVEGGQLNDTAVMLEGDTSLSEGGRVHLNLSQLAAYRLFPGQVRHEQPGHLQLLHVPSGLAHGLQRL